MRHLFHSDMSLKICVGLVFAFALNRITVTGFHFSDLFGSDHNSNDYEHVNSKIYNIHEKIGSSKGACVKHVTATGNGVGDKFHLPCSRVFTITSDKILLYGNPEKDTFSLFSYSPSTLIVLQEGKCSERKYKTGTEKPVAESSELNEDDCKQVRNKINYIIDQESKVLDMLATYFDKKASQIPSKYAFNDGKSTFKSVTEDSKHQNGVTDTNKKPSPSYQSEKYANEIQQQNARKGIMVTELLSAPSKSEQSLMNQPEQSANKDLTVAVSHQDGVTVTEQVSNPPKSQPSADATPNHAKSAASNSNFGRFRATYDKLKEKVSNHMKTHHKSDNGWDFN